jgi:hypothetical protein
MYYYFILNICHLVVLVFGRVVARCAHATCALNIDETMILTCVQAATGEKEKTAKTVKLLAYTEIPYCLGVIRLDMVNRLTG